jgi:hypothetical protein
MVASGEEDVVTKKGAAEARVEEMIREGADAEAIVAAALDAVPAPGECRIQDGRHNKGDFPEVRPVLTEAGLRFCCTYDHCTAVIVPLAKG